MDPEDAWGSQPGAKEYPAATARVSPTQSQEELDAWSTDEHLGEVERARLLLADGQLPQKLTIVTGLRRLLMEPDSEDLLQFLIASAPSWPEDLVIECGKQLAAAVAEGLIVSLFQSDILAVAFQLIEPAVEPVVEAWTQVVCRIMAQMPVSGVAEECVPTILRLSDFSQGVALRRAGTALLSSLADILGGKLTPDILHRCSLLAQDTDYRIRMAACGTLTSVSRALPATVLQSKVFPEIQTLLEDENEEVQREAVELVAKVLPLFSPEFLEKEVCGVVSKTMLCASDFTVKVKVAQCFGEICVGLKFVLVSDLRTQCLSLFTEFANHPSPLIRKNAAYNFPAVLSVLISPPHITYFRVIYAKLCRDEKPEVRQPALAGFHEVARMLADQTDFLVSLMTELLEDKSIHWTLLRVLPSCPSFLWTEGILRKLGTLASSSTEWRKQLSALEICAKLLEKMDPRIFYEVLLSAVCRLVTAGAWLLRMRAVELLADFIKRTHYSEMKSSLCTFLTETLGESKRFVDRIAFIYCCLRVISNSSKRFFKRNFLDTLLALGKDPVWNVRISFSEHLTTFRKAIGNDHSENASKFAGILNSMLVDPCSLVSQNAQVAHSSIMTQSFWKEITSLREINLESQKVAFENHQAEEERVEQEEARKRILEEITAKARGEFQPAKGTARSRHSRKPTNAQFSLSPGTKKSTPAQETSRSNYYRGPPKAYVLRTYRKAKPL